MKDSSNKYFLNIIFKKRLLNCCNQVSFNWVMQVPCWTREANNLKKKRSKISINSTSQSSKNKRKTHTDQTNQMNLMKSIIYLLTIQKTLRSTELSMMNQFRSRSMKKNCLRRWRKVLLPHQHQAVKSTKHLRHLWNIIEV